MKALQAKTQAVQDGIQKHENLITGGSKEEVMLTYNMVVGGALNDLKSLRIDPNGRTINSGVHIQKSGLTVDERACSHIEHVYTPNLQGDYTAMVANKYEIMVGSNGINMETLGRYNMVGGIVTLMGREVTISSDNCVLIDGGKSLKLIADNINICGREIEKSSGKYKSIGIDSNLGINGNLTTKGGHHVEGQLSTHSITAPVEFTESEPTLNFQSLKGGVKIGKVRPNGDVISVPAKDFSAGATRVVNAGIPMNLLDSNDAVRQSAMGNNSPELVLAKPVENGGRVIKRPPWSFDRYNNPTFHALLDDCKEESDVFDMLIDQYITGEIDKEKLQSLLTRASDSPISETNKGGDCKVCD